MRLKAVNRAVGTGWLVFQKRAEVDPFFRVTKNVQAFLAGNSIGLMMRTTENFDHRSDGFYFPFNPPISCYAFFHGTEKVLEWCKIT